MVAFSIIVYTSAAFTRNTTDGYKTCLLLVDNVVSPTSKVTKGKNSAKGNATSEYYHALIRMQENWIARKNYVTEGHTRCYHILNNLHFKSIRSDTITFLY